MRIGLRFVGFEVEKEEKCNYDYVNISGVAGDESKMVFCGDTLPPPVRSESNELEIVFKSDSSVTKG